MTEPISTVVKVAKTPEQAKIFVAMLRAEGIPAFSDSQTQDEFAMSQRMLNLSSVKVMVPSSAAARAREILAPHEVDQDELMRQAVESMDDPDAEREE